EDHGIRAGGYGILLAKSQVDELIYNQAGNEVLLVKYVRHGKVRSRQSKRFAPAGAPAGIDSVPLHLKTRDRATCILRGDELAILWMHEPASSHSKRQHRSFAGLPRRLCQ